MEQGRTGSPPPIQLDRPYRAVDHRASAAQPVVHGPNYPECQRFVDSPQPIALPSQWNRNPVPSTGDRPPDHPLGPPANPRRRRPPQHPPRPLPADLVIPDIADPHLHNPAWPPHAKFHDTQYIGMGALIGAIWRSYGAERGTCAPNSSQLPHSDRSPGWPCGARCARRPPAMITCATTARVV
ncbi:DUF6640 family protein [Nocardia sp. CA-135953]|uniref:DUF6640 family protein n=1 Tax=Nocardia sp. CA-135953 TaxID=3239978 RepID=UPI003D951294